MSALIVIETVSASALLGIIMTLGFSLYATVSFRNSAAIAGDMQYLRGFAIIGLPSLSCAMALLARLLRSLLRRTLLARIDASKAQRELRSLREALDCSKDGVAVLDGEMRVQFANQVFMRLFRFFPTFIERKPLYFQVVNTALAGGAYDIEPDQQDNLVKERIAFVRSGNPQPVLLKLAGGKKIRFTCSVLPDGGRMLNYTDVTDMVDEAARLEDLANLDGLTGLANRRQLNVIAHRDFERARREKTPMAIILLDIDRFKRVNDDFGHDIGDRAICHVANICRDSKRSTDFVARIGGEEYVIVLPDTTSEGAMVISERIRRRVEANPLIINGNHLALTISAGVAELDESCGDFASLMKRADRLLYEAKAKGRNRVATVSPEADQAAITHAA
ncbi:MAG: GGDEF domain-containing protein [Hyphomicrobiales bacterium]|nr:GGDEF domain-containing protein [Hyphomicrobiales bacterium]